MEFVNPSIRDLSNDKLANKIAQVFSFNTAEELIESGNEELIDRADKVLNIVQLAHKWGADSSLIVYMVPVLMSLIQDTSDPILSKIHYQQTYIAIRKNYPAISQEYDTYEKYLLKVQESRISALIKNALDKSRAPGALYEEIVYPNWVENHLESVFPDGNILLSPTNLNSVIKNDPLNLVKDEKITKFDIIQYKLEKFWKKMLQAVGIKTT